MSLSSEDIRWILTAMIVLIASVGIHEYGHAWVANRLGDETPRRQGRLTLNPLAHADPIGTFVLPLMGLLAPRGALGWGKPVQTQPTNYTRKYSMTAGQMMVAIAGPSMNIFLGVVVAAVHIILIKTAVVKIGDPINRALEYAVTLNFTLFFFNLVPAPPLDGGWVAQHLTPYRYRAAFEKFATYGPFIVMAVVMISPLSRIFTVPAQWVTEHVYRGFASVAGL